jgi:hypothetical protein
MPKLKYLTGINSRLLSFILVMPLIISCLASCDNHPASKSDKTLSGSSSSSEENRTPEGYKPVYAMLLLPKNPDPGQAFRVLSIGGEKLRKALITVSGPDGVVESVKTKCGDELPYWRIDDFKGGSAGKYSITLTEDKRIVSNLELTISPVKQMKTEGIVWKTLRGWDSATEAIYSA